ncbi:hypothetical protein PV04_07547 [Phialophora macrospora]|uniref:Uncharacterized protein n=1 Tax=Phialophora macrospora TaxID=1851006 RepID=A0A0D2FZG8_9EURO|nr:hypothetical protein PV04_07547 [Phialophora macrospora]
MSQAVPNTPSVISNAANIRQQVPLRDYLNARVAPFLKKAITESLNAEAEFPLQWLGECLIHQSILYEGNPDRTNIRERFLYKFDDPKPVEQSNADSAASPPPVSSAAASPATAPPAAAPPTVAPPAAASPAPLESAIVSPPQEDRLQEQPEVLMNDASDAPTQEAPPPQGNEISLPQATVTPDAPSVNGIKEEEEKAPHQATDGDTDMGGTS